MNDEQKERCSEISKNEFLWFRHFSAILPLFMLLMCSLFALGSKNTMKVSALSFWLPAFICLLLSITLIIIWNRMKKNQLKMTMQYTFLVQKESTPNFTIPKTWENMHGDIMMRVMNNYAKRRIVISNIFSTIILLTAIMMSKFADNIGAFLVILIMNTTLFLLFPYGDFSEKELSKAFEDLKM